MPISQDPIQVQPTFMPPGVLPGMKAVSSPRASIGTDPKKKQRGKRPAAQTRKAVGQRPSYVSDSRRDDSDVTEYDLGNTEIMQMAAENADRALDELEVDNDRDDGNEDRLGT